MPTPVPLTHTGKETPPSAGSAVLRLALIGNPNTGKTTLFNRLCGLRHKTSNFPGTTQEARIGTAYVNVSSAGGVKEPLALEVIDLPGIYSLELEMSEAEICRRVLAGTLAIPGTDQSAIDAPDAVCVVVDATNLPRNLLLVGEVLRRRLPTVIVLNMVDIARTRGLTIEPGVLEDALGCRVIPCVARSGEGIETLRLALPRAVVPNQTPPGSAAGPEALERWADQVCERIFTANAGSLRASALTDRLDRIVTHPIAGLLIFLTVMAGVFWAIFSAAQIPMNMLDAIFGGNPDWVASWQPAFAQTIISDGLIGLTRRTLPDGLLSDFLCDGVLGGIGATVVFLPQICLLFFLISLLEDTGYLARGAFLMNRLLRPFGLPGHSFVPLLSSHACALPGIVACRGIPDRKERLATILVAPFMTCSARLPVYVLLTSVLFPTQPLKAALAFLGCYALGAAAGVFSALIARRTFLKGERRPMAMELPTYKLPSLRTALLGSIDRGLMFLKKAGTIILAICIVLWWLGTFPKVKEEPPQATQWRAEAASTTDADTAADLTDRADRMAHSHAKAFTYIGRLGHTVQPLFAPLGMDWQQTVGVLTSFAAREVFVSTMSVVVTGNEDAESPGVLEELATAQRSDGSPLFGRANAWAVLVFFVLAMQCLPTLVVTARESGSYKWALLQFLWMTAVAYGAGALTFALLS
jgi:ferrous iron transport protein B